MEDSIWAELISSLRTQLRPYGYTGHILPYFAQKAQHLEDMIKRTALMSESNSVLIIGPRGGGKSALLEYVVGKAFKNKSIKDNMLDVRLDGLVHTNDNLALEDITKQLSLSEFEDVSLGSFSEKLRLVLSALKSGNKDNKSILFVLDNFDLFSTHKNQTLLYNLFDVAQSQQSPICVVGMSSRPDVLQILENRVNSRFSHQKILLLEEMTFDEYTDSAKHFLTLHSFRDNKFLKKWNSEIANLLKDDTLKNILELVFNCNNTLRSLKELLYLVVQSIGENHLKLTSDDFQVAYTHYSADDKSAVMKDLSVLELSLVIAMMHLTDMYDGEPFNFEMMYKVLSNFFKKKMNWHLEKRVVLKAFEHLIDLEVVKACSESSSNKILKQFTLVRLLVDENEVKYAVSNYQNLPLPLKHWTESSLDC